MDIVESPGILLMESKCELNRELMHSEDLLSESIHEMKNINRESRENDTKNAQIQIGRLSPCKRYMIRNREVPSAISSLIWTDPDIATKKQAELTCLRFERSLTKGL